MFLLKWFTFSTLDSWFTIEYFMIFFCFPLRVALDTVLQSSGPPWKVDKREVWLVSSLSLVSEVKATIEWHEMSKWQGFGDVLCCGTPSPMRFTWYKTFLCYQITTFSISCICLEKCFSYYYFSLVKILFSWVLGTFFIILKSASHSAASICSFMTLYQPAVWCQ